LHQLPVNDELDLLARRFDINLDQPLATLSSGMKRKVALLQVFAPHAALVIMDEPTNALDPTMRDELLVQVRQARNRGQAVLFSSHVLSEVEQVCDRVGILRRGELVHVQHLDALRSGRVVRARFESPPASWPVLDGLVVRDEAPGACTLEHTGPLPPLLDWLSQQAVTDLQIAPLGLGPLYHRYHGAEA
jgi:ABC-2 type transport system ATP-binding protein